MCDVTANLELHSRTESNQCPHCLFTFNNGISFKQHQCIFKINTDLNTNHVVLKRPKNWKETLTIVRQLCEEDVVKLCILNNWCLPEFYPFCFPHQIRSGRTGTIPLLETMTASKHSANLLNKLLEMDEVVTLPKCLLLTDEESGLSAMLPPRVLIPSSNFVYTETSEHFIVTKVSTEPNEDFDLQEKDTKDDQDSSDEEINFTFESPHTYMGNPNRGILNTSSLHILIQNEHNYHAEPGVSENILTQANIDFHEGDNRVDLAEDLNRSADHITSGDCNSGDEYPNEDGADDRIEDEMDRSESEESVTMPSVHGGDDGGGDDDDDDGGDNDGSDDDGSEDDMNRTNDENILSQELLDILPSDFEPGIDGMGARNIQQRQASSYYRKPWKFTDYEIQNLIRMTKSQFFNLVLTCVGAQVRKSGLNIFAQCFLMLLKLVHQVSFATIL